MVPNYGEFSGAGLSSGAGTSSAADGEKPWGELNIVPGSIKVAPRKIILAKEKYWIGRNSQGMNFGSIPMTFTFTLEKNFI